MYNIKWLKCIEEINGHEKGKEFYIVIKKRERKDKDDEKKNMQKDNL